MKKILTVVISLLAFSYANAQLEPKTTQLHKDDTTSVPIRHRPADKTVIANKSLLRRNTIESGTGKPDPIKTDIQSNEPISKPIPTSKNRVEAVTDTITRKPNK